MLENLAVTGGKPEAHPALILNADFKPLEYLPLSVVDWKDAIGNVLSDSVTVVKEHEVEIHSQFLTMRLPSIIAVRKYVERRRTPSLTRTNVLVLRDRRCCAYCGHTYSFERLTYDHVIPKAQNGRHIWENVVSSCMDCNQRKADKTPEQAGMKLLWRPWKPSMEELARADFFIHQRKLHEGWEEYLPFVA